MTQKSGGADDTTTKTTSAFLVQLGDAVASLRFANAQFALVQVSRGMGPRALEEWLASNDGCIWPRDDDKTRRRPQVVSPHYRAYLQSLVLIARDKPTAMMTMQSSSALSYSDYTLTVEAIIQGRPDRKSLERLATQQPHPCHVDILRSVPSNTAGILSHVSLTTSTSSSNSPPLPSKFFRRQLEAAGFPVLGKAEGSRSFRGHRLLMATVRLQVSFVKSQQQRGDDGYADDVVAAELESPALFTTLLDKEERVWQHRQRQDGSVEESSRRVSRLVGDYQSWRNRLGKHGVTRLGDGCCLLRHFPRHYRLVVVDVAKRVLPCPTRW